MSAAEHVKPAVPQGSIPTWDEEKEFFRMRRWYRLLTATIVYLWVALIGWVLFFAPINQAQVRFAEAGMDLWLVFAPILITGILAEGLVGTFFYIIEASWKSMVAYLGKGLSWLKNAETELVEARQWFVDVSARYSREMNNIQLDSTESLTDLTQELGLKLSAADQLMDMAKRRLDRAEENLAGLITFEGYKSVKAAVTVILGVTIGVIMATLMQLQIFALLGVSVPARIDVLVTGLIIGVSTVPIRAIITNLGGLVNRVGTKIL